MEIIYLTTHDLNIEGKQPKYADHIINFSQSVEGEDTFKSYFSKHIEKQRISNAAKPSKFLDIEKNDFLKLLNNISEDIDENNIFLENTKNMTLKLHRNMKNVSKSNGLLIFVVYKIEGTHFLCIMKMEPENGVRYDPENIKLTEINNLLPSSQTRLHKVAFFSLEEVNEDYRFMVLDKQVKEDDVCTAPQKLDLKSNVWGAFIWLNMIWNSR